MKNIKLLLLVNIVNMAFVGGFLRAQEENKFPKVVGHRGLIFQAPENTLAGFEACMNLRLGLELDIQRTKDGVLVLMHDSEVNRTTNGKGKVSEITLAELKKLDAGSWFDIRFKGEKVPTLEEFLLRLARYKESNPLVCVDVKIDDDQLVEEMVGLARKHQVLEYLMFIGRTITEAGFRERLKKADAKAKVARLAQTSAELPAALEDPLADWIYVRFLPTPQEVSKVHQKGKKVFVVGSLVAGNLPENWRKAGESGADALLTDYPLECVNSWRKGNDK